MMTYLLPFSADCRRIGRDRCTITVKLAVYCSLVRVIDPVGLGILMPRLLGLYMSIWSETKFYFFEDLVH